MKTARFLTITVALVLVCAATAGDASPRPTAARIVPVKGEPDDWVGNVSVRFSDGHRESWTAKGHCMIPKVAQSGLVGWTHAIGPHSRGGWMNNELRIARAGRLIAVFQADNAFIDFWTFADSDTCVVLRGVNVHGPTWIKKYRLDTGSSWRRAPVPITSRNGRSRTRMKRSLENTDGAISRNDSVGALIHESHDLAAEKPEKLRELAEVWEKQWTQIQADAKSDLPVAKGRSSAAGGSGLTHKDRTIPDDRPLASESAPKYFLRVSYKQG